MADLQEYLQQEGLALDDAAGVGLFHLDLGGLGVELGVVIGLHVFLVLGWLGGLLGHLQRIVLPFDETGT